MELPNPNPNPNPNPAAALLFYIVLVLTHHAATASLEESVYIVHVDKSLMPKPFSSHHHWYSSILASLDQTDTISATHRNLIYVYDNAFHGFSALLTQLQLHSVRKSPGILSAYLDFEVIPDTTRSPEFLSLSTSAGLWPASGYGKDVIIGVIDSGIWPESPSFRDDGMTEVPVRWKGICQEGQEFNSSLCNRKLIGARYFNAGGRAANPDVIITMNSARDITGHGTHVAAIAAGNFVDGVSYYGYATGTARGVAPHARVSVYKVLFNFGTGSDTIAGIDQAVADGVDIISISVSTGPDNINLYDNPIAIAGFGAREKGILVCYSGGNRGPSIGTLRSGIPWGIVVAAGSIDRWFAGKLTLGNGNSITGWSLFPGSASVRNLPIYYNETESACNSINNLSHQFTIVVCNLSMENAFFDSIIFNLPRSNYRAAIIIGDDPTVYETSQFSFPAVVITPADGRKVIDYITRNPTPTATISFQETILGLGPRPAPALADFSSKGPARSYEGILKPDIMAPGVLILSAYSPEANVGEGPRIGDNIYLRANYTLLSGTSMACPHISGVAALLKAAHPEWSAAAIQSAMMTTANPLNNANQPIRETDGLPTTPLGIGSGQVDPNRALNPGLVYENSPQDFVNLVCSMNFTSDQTRTIIRSNYNCSTPSSDLNYPSFVTVFYRRDEGKILNRSFRRTVTNVGDGAATYRVRVEAPENTTVTVRPSMLGFKKKYEKRSYSVRVRYVADIESQNRAGTITWVDETGKFIVRSPIMVSAGADFFG